MEAANEAIAISRHSLCIRAFSGVESSIPCELPPHLFDDNDLAEYIASLDDTASTTMAACSNGSCESSVLEVSKVEKKLRPKFITASLEQWLGCSNTTPYANTTEKTAIATVLGITLAKVQNFCNNYRKRFTKVDGKMNSYTKYITTSSVARRHIISGGEQIVSACIQ
jgi:hypothetical protein